MTSRCIHCDGDVWFDDEDFAWTHSLSWSEGGTGAYCAEAPNHDHDVAVIL